MIGRADERAALRAALRARVEALRHEEDCNVPRGLAEPDRVPQCNCLRGIVLDLLVEDTP